MTGAPPICLAMVLCDHVHKDPATGKSSVLGTFSSIFAPQFPAVHPGLAVFLQLTDGHGEAQLLLKIVRITAESLEGAKIFEGALPYTFTDRRIVAEIHLWIANLILPEPGEYRVVLESNGALVVERRLLAIQIQQ